MKALYEEVFSNTKSLLEGTFDGGVRWGIAEPKDRQTENVVLRFGTSVVVDVDTSKCVIEDHSIRFHISSISVTKIVEAFDRLFGHFRRLAMPLSSGHVLDVSKLAQSLEMNPDKIETGDEVWEGLLILVFKTQRLV